MINLMTMDDDNDPLWLFCVYINIYIFKLYKCMCYVNGGWYNMIVCMYLYTWLYINMLNLCV